MKINRETYFQIKQSLQAGQVLVAVSKLQPVEAILELYQLGHRDFGENYVQELLSKQAQLPADIRWHFIGHLQSNKVKYIAPFVHLIHGVDSEKLLKEIDKQSVKNNRCIPCLLQVHIVEEETKFGFDENEVKEFITQNFFHYTAADTKKSGAVICGLMGMASFSDDENKIRNEFKHLRHIYKELNKWFKEKNACSPTNSPNLEPLNLLSMGMSSDYTIALEEGSNMLRIGSLLFGARQYNKT